MSTSFWKSVAAVAMGLALGVAPGLAPSRVAAPTALPLGLQVAAESPANPIVARLVAEHPGLHVLRAVVADIDGDGDLDVVASTADAPVVLWINDGTNHFTRGQAPARASLSSEPNATVRPLGHAVPGIVGGSKWHALGPDVRHDDFSPTWIAVAPAIVTARTLEILASGPSRAPPTTLSA